MCQLARIPRIRSAIHTGILAGILILSVQTPVADENRNRQGANKDTRPPPSPMVYRPPFRGAPSNRVLGGTRNAGTRSTVLSVISPEHTGLSGSPQPNLYFFVSDDVDDDVQIALTRRNAIEPIIDRTISGGIAAGIHLVSLASMGVSLNIGQEYRFSVAIIHDSANRSKDTVSSGFIARAQDLSSLEGKIESDDDRDLAHVYAENGLWYDAFAAVSRADFADGADESYHQVRADLLKQVGLGHVASHDLFIVRSLNVGRND